MYREEGRNKSEKQSQQRSKNKDHHRTPKRRTCVEMNLDTDRDRDGQTNPAREGDARPNRIRGKSPDRDGDSVGERVWLK